MQSNFEAACKNAREFITVPATPLAAIRNAAVSRDAEKPRMRRMGLPALLLAGASVIAIAAGAAVWGGTHVSFGKSGTMQLTTNSETHTYSPTAADLRSAAQAADFPVILPAGLPTGTTPMEMVTAGKNAILIRYNLSGAWRASNHLLAFLIMNPRLLSAAAPHSQPTHKDITLLFGPGSPNHEQSWRIGQERVIVFAESITPAELARIKSAMIASAR